VQCRQIVFQSRIAQAQFHRAKTLRKLLRLVRNRFRRHQAEAAAVVGRNGLWVGAEQAGKRQSGRDGQRVPARHVEPGHGHAHDALHADESEPLAELLPKIDWGNAIPLRDLQHLVQDARNRRCGRADIAEQIRSAGDALVGLHIDQDQRRLGDRSAAGPERAGHRHLHADGTKVTDREGGRADLHDVHDQTFLEPNAAPY
jgi:hypothetical protein